MAWYSKAVETAKGWFSKSTTVVPKKVEAIVVAKKTVTGISQCVGTGPGKSQRG